MEGGINREHCFVVRSFNKQVGDDKIKISVTDNFMHYTLYRRRFYLRNLSLWWRIGSNVSLRVAGHQYPYMFNSLTKYYSSVAFCYKHFNVLVRWSQPLISPHTRYSVLDFWLLRFIFVYMSVVCLLFTSLYEIDFYLVIKQLTWSLTNSWLFYCI